MTEAWGMTKPAMWFLLLLWAAVDEAGEEDFKAHRPPVPSGPQI
jgi:hypothetical protein